MPTCDPLDGLSSTLDPLSPTRETPTEKLPPEPTGNSPVGLPLSGSTDQSSVPVGENLSTTWP